MKIFLNLIVSAGLVLMTACGSANIMPVDSTSDEAQLLSTPTPVDAADKPAMTPLADTLSFTAQMMVDLSRENLRQMLKTSIDEIVMIEVEPVIWPDASLGCPKIGVAYIQVLTPGFLVLLEADGQQYHYHTDESETVVLCKESDLPTFPVTPGEIDDGQPWMPAN